MISHVELGRRFNYHAPDVAKEVKHLAIREYCKGLAEYIVDTTPEGREQSLALTHLEESMFWANASIARS